MLPHRTASWAALERLAAGGPPAILPLFEREPDRLSRLGLTVAGLRFDWSKLPVTAGQLDALLALAEAADVAGLRDAVAAGAIVNPSESRAATHMALRDPSSRDHGALLALAARLRAGSVGPIRHLIHIGIGGSALGPQLLVDALGRDGDGPEIHIVANIDGEALHRATLAADPATTRLVAVSKTFTTQETRQNLASAQAWLAANGIADPAGRTIAVTAAPARAAEAGIAAEYILPFDESVGGRYSLWSAVGLPLAARAGPAAFEALLDGAHAMDRHWRTAPFAANAPVLAALLDVWQASFLRQATRAIFAYDERLRLLPFYLQQLEMESNGKAVARDGTPLPFPTAPVTWGGTGTDAQHAVFQLLHQGISSGPVEFIAVRTPGHKLDPVHHRLLIANCFAQGAALLAGRPAGSDEPLARQKHFPGNRPSSTILLDRLDPATLGALLAFHEARTITAAACMGLNPFDQWGVELGKEVASRLASGDASGFDPSTAALMAAARPPGAS